MGKPVDALVSVLAHLITLPAFIGNLAMFVLTFAGMGCSIWQAESRAGFGVMAILCAFFGLGLANAVKDQKVPIRALGFGLLSVVLGLASLVFWQIATQNV